MKQTKCKDCGIILACDSCSERYDKVDLAMALAVLLCITFWVFVFW